MAIYTSAVGPEVANESGLVAEDAEKVDADLVGYTGRYEAIKAMLLNEFLKEHRIVQELKSIAARQEANAAKQEATIAKQQKQIEALTAGLQRVSAQIEASQTAPQVAKSR